MITKGLLLAGENVFWNLEILVLV